MSIAFFLRKNFTNLPYPLGKFLSYIPYTLRPGIGEVFRKQRRLISNFHSFAIEEKQVFIFKNLKNIVDFAYANVEFYKDYYSSKNFRPDYLKCFDDINRIPIINKKTLQKYDIEYRSNINKPKQLTNTGGSSGAPLSFYLSPGQMGNEWAHMHKIWEKLGFRPQKLKLSFGGDSAIVKGFRYDSVRHTLWFNIYADFKKNEEELLCFIRKNPVFFLHGYPSALYEFALNCKDSPELLATLKMQLQGAFLSSEFPNPLYRENIEKVFGIKTISWYGHTERCILAYEKYRPFEYVPFQTYGYAEVKKTNFEKPSLIGTSYYNQASPLIRYDTEDYVTDYLEEQGLLISFKVNEGRGGQFIIDRFNKKISLTALIFGRHHKLFDYCNHIQIAQEEPGHAYIFFVPKSGENLDRPENLFDSKNVAMFFRFFAIKEPIRTSSGKINLLVKPKNLPLLVENSNAVEK